MKIVFFFIINFYASLLLAQMPSSEALESQFLETFNNEDLLYLEGSNRHKIAYKKFGHPSSHKSVVFVHGTGENMQRYKEIARYFFINGFNVFLYDQRGHGYSGRFTDNKVKIHTDGFHRQVEDLSFMVNLAVEGVKDNEVYIVGHSMGGLISLRYLELFPDTIARAVVTSPMLKMQTPFPETASYYIAKGACYFGKCEDWIMGQNPENVKDASYLDLRETHNERLHEDYVAAIKKDPDNRITWGVTYGWFKQAMDMEYQVRDDKEISKINTDFLMLTATDDYFVDVETQKVFCSKTQRCRQIEFEGSWHNLLQETDQYRLRAFDLMLEFFSKN